VQDGFGSRELGRRPELQGPLARQLYVVDTSCFPSIGAVYPALTAMANALRVGDHLLERLD
jgi:choline dehydrogenase-like flavoprotein